MDAAPVIACLDPSCDGSTVECPDCHGAGEFPIADCQEVGCETCGGEEDGIGAAGLGTGRIPCEDHTGQVPARRARSADEILADARDDEAAYAADYGGEE